MSALFGRSNSLFNFLAWNSGGGPCTRGPPGLCPPCPPHCYATGSCPGVPGGVDTYVCMIAGIDVKKTHTQPCNGPLSGTTQVSRYQKGKTNLDFTEARDSEWQWHQLGHMQICTLLQTNNHASTHCSVFYRPDALHASQPTVSKH